PRVQREFLRELRAHAKKLILVLTGGGAIAIPDEHAAADAVLHAWYPGCEGGRALADVLFGDVSPSGKLPITVPRATADLPDFADYHMRGRTYRFVEREPLYPFGFGLSYAQPRYGALNLSAPALREGQPLTVRVVVSNATAVEANETVQCYFVPPREWPEAPRATLIDFKKISLPANGAAPVEFQIPSEAFRCVDPQGNKVW